MELTTIQGITCYEKDGVAYLNLEACARGLGFIQTQNKNGTEYVSVRWETVRKYLLELGFDVFPDKLGKDGLPDFIPENIFYRLAMKAKNETAEKFQALVADEIIPSIRKTGAYAMKLLSPLEQLQLQVEAMKEIEQRQDAQQLALDAANHRLDNIGDIISLNPTDWRRESKSIIVKIANKLGGNEFIRDVNNEIYKLMLDRFSIDVKRRLMYMQQRASLNGLCKSKCEALNRLDAIAEDKKAVEAYLIIVKEIAIKYGIDKK